MSRVKSNFKSVMALTLVAMLSMLMFVGCKSKRKEYVGNWKMTGISMDGIETNPITVGYDLRFELKEDGTVIVTAFGESESGQWDVTKEGISISSEGTSTENLTDKDGALVLEEDGIVMTFTKA